MIRPNGKMRGSRLPSSLVIGVSDVIKLLRWLWCIATSAFTRMVRNFQMVNSLPCRPILLCFRTAGPGEVILMIAATLRHIGATRTKPKPAPKMSMTRFQIGNTGVVRTSAQLAEVMAAARTLGGLMGGDWTRLDSCERFREDLSEAAGPVSVSFCNHWPG